MLTDALNTLSNVLSDHVKKKFNLDEDIASLLPLPNSQSMTPGNKIHLTLVNVERETAHGIAFSHKSVSESHYRKGGPTWHLNLYVMISAVFPEKQYEEALQVLSGVFQALQLYHVLPLPQGNATLSIEPVNLSFTELSNLWGILGGSYYPSILCKIRTLSIDGGETKEIGRVIDEPALTL